MKSLTYISITLFVGTTAKKHKYVVTLAFVLIEKKKHSFGISSYHF